MNPTRPVEVLREAALSDLAAAGKKLRCDGWDAQLIVDAAEPYEDHFYDVKLVIRIGHSMRIPVEARDAA